MTISGIEIPDAWANNAIAVLKHQKAATENLRAQHEPHPTRKAVSISADTPDGKTYTVDILID